MPKKTLPKQRDIVELDLEREGKHPYIVLSNNLAIEIEDGFFVCAMMTSQEMDDEFTFELTDDLLEKPNNKDYSEVRCQMIHFVHLDQIIPNKNKNRITEEGFSLLIKKINNSTFKQGELEMDLY